VEDFILISRCSRCLTIPKKTPKNKLNKEHEPSCLREAMVRHTSMAPRPLETEQTDGIAGERGRTQDGFQPPLPDRPLPTIVRLLIFLKFQK
jgi:hypothetical protein